MASSSNSVRLIPASLFLRERAKKESNSNSLKTTVEKLDNGYICTKMTANGIFVEQSLSIEDKDKMNVILQKMKDQMVANEDYKNLAVKYVNFSKKIICFIKDEKEIKVNFSQDESFDKEIMEIYKNNKINVTKPIKFKDEKSKHSQHLDTFFKSQELESYNAKPKELKKESFGFKTIRDKFVGKSISSLNKELFSQFSLLGRNPLTNRKILNAFEENMKIIYSYILKIDAEIDIEMQKLQDMLKEKENEENQISKEEIFKKIVELRNIKNCIKNIDLFAIRVAVLFKSRKSYKEPVLPNDYINRAQELYNFLTKYFHLQKDEDDKKKYIFSIASMFLEDRTQVDTFMKRNSMSDLPKKTIEEVFVRELEDMSLAKLLAESNR